MITVFNREMLLITHDANVYYNALDFLKENSIVYSSQIRYAKKNRSLKKGGRIDMDARMQYGIYVHRKDYERAKHIIDSHYKEIYV